MAALFLLAASPEKAVSADTPSVQCPYDAHLLDLGTDAFDQDMKGGWRELAKKPGCEREAADLIRQYREKNIFMILVLYWHEAQLRALVGDYEAAIPLMEKSRQPDRDDIAGWNPYVDATIAFLKNDRNAFLMARERLEHFRKPADWSAEEEWPQNGGVVTGLWNCFGKPYKEAYGLGCRSDGAGSDGKR